MEDKSNKFKVDYVVTYLDPTDPYWLEQFRPYQKDEMRKQAERYDVDGKRWLKYHFRGIAKNMPWVNNVFLVVFSESQVPEWINRDTVKIVTDDMYIPSKYLPTFNASTKQMHLQFIPGLEERFLMVEDDMFAINEQKIEYYFDEFGNPNYPKIGSYTLVKPDKNVVWDNIYFNSVMFAYDILGMQHEENKVTGVEFRHIPHPCIKSDMIKYYSENEEYIDSTITPCRDAKNVIGLAWGVANWLKYPGRISISTKEIQWFNCEEETDITKYWKNGTDVLNINCNKFGDLYTGQFAEIFPDKCKYEK